MKILVIDTAGATASVSVINEKKEIFTELSDDRMSHLQMLMPVAKRTMEKAGVKKEEITHVAVAVGPGSFTGIRIGMAAAMTLAQAWDLPMAAVSSLSCYTYAFSDERALICPMIDARHGQVFCGAFLSADAQNGEGFLPKTVKEEKLRNGAEFAEQMVCAGETEVCGDAEFERIIFCGDAAEKYASPAVKLAESVFARESPTAGQEPEAENRGRCDEERESLETKVTRAVRSVISDPDPEHYARAVALSAFHQVQAGRLVSCETIRPVYLRKSEAERKLEAKELGRKKKDRAAEDIIFELPPADEEITYRPAAAGDAAGAASLDRLCFRTPWSLSSFEGDLSGGKDTIYITARNSRDEIVGFAGIAYVMDEGEVNRVAVRPLYRARGIADRMMELLLTAAEQKGIKTQFLEVRESNRQAIALYKNHGFSVIGKRDGYYAETGENALIMRRE